MIRNQCKFPGCFTLCNDNYCDKHLLYGKAKEAQQTADRKPFRNADRPNEHLYNTDAWRKLSRKHRKEHPYCSKCGSTIDCHTHHVIRPKGNPILFYDESNLITLCRKCHSVVTGYEQH